jgi:hypothetical protein
MESSFGNVGPTQQVDQHSHDEQSASDISSSYQHNPKIDLLKNIEPKLGHPIS